MCPGIARMGAHAALPGWSQDAAEVTEGFGVVRAGALVLGLVGLRVGSVVGEVVLVGWVAFVALLVGVAVAFDVGQGTREDARTRSVAEPLASALRAALRSTVA